MNRRHRNEYTYDTCIAILQLLILPLLLLFRLIRWLYRRNEKLKYEKQLASLSAFNDELEEEELAYDILNIQDSPELPEMCQIFQLGNDTVLGIQYVSFCPDETAHVRVIGDTAFSQIYKKKVMYDKDDDRYIVVSGQRYYLDLLKTQPVDPTQDKKGK